MLLKSIGEFGLLERIQRRIRLDASVIRGPGDDCAVVAFDRSRYLLLTCDMIVAGVDFRRSEDPMLVGRKAVAISISDIAACGGLPRYCLVSLGLPVKTTVESVDRLLTGALGICRRYGISVVGGDISRARDVTVDVSMTGIVEKKNLILRSGARQGDAVCVTGSLGGSLSGKHLRFVPRLKEARFLARNTRVHAMIDVSDGLVQDLGHILRESRVGAVLYEERVPLAPRAKGMNDALYQGEDFELLFTMPAHEAERLARKKHFFTVIGRIVGKAEGLTIEDASGRRHRPLPRGFRHF